MTGEVIAYLGLGSNLEPRLRYLARGLKGLASHPGIRVLRRSAVRETAPVGGPPQGPYLNAVVEVATSIAPRGLLEACRAIEGASGRRRSLRWGPRTLDIDLLFYGDIILCEADLEVPHPRIRERRFVLEPLVDLAPDMIHPLLGVTLRDLLTPLLDHAHR